MIQSPRIPFLLVILAAAWVGLASCDGSESHGAHGADADNAPGRSFDAAAPSLGDEPFMAAATVGMIGDLVRAVAGDRAAVQTIVKSGVDPHTYTPSRADINALLNADIVFYNGLHLEGQMGSDLERIGRSKPVVAVTELLEEDDVLIADGAEDPHVWMDPVRWSHAVTVVERALSEFDPPRSETYAANATAYRSELEKLNDYALSRTATIPAGNRVLVTAHDAFNYFGLAYDIEVIGVQGLSTESEAGLADINRLVDMLVDRSVPAVFVETSVADKNVRALIEGAESRGHDVRVGGELFSDAMGDPGTYEGTYVGMIDHNVTTIVRALGGDAPERGLNGKLSHGEGAE